MKLAKVIAGLALGALTGGSALAQPAPPPPPRAAARDAVRDGTIQQVLLSPHGDIDGIVLRDATVVRFPPHAVVAATRLRPGAAVHVTGAEVDGTAGPTLFDARVTAGGAIVADPGQPPPRPPAGAVDDKPLATLTVTGRVRQVLVNREGNADAAVLDDGAVVHVGPGGALARAGVAKGAQLTATGTGGTYPLGRSIDADTLKVGAGAVITVDRVAPPRPPTP